MSKQPSRRKFFQTAGLAATSVMAAVSPLPAGSPEPQTRPALRTMGARFRELLLSGTPFENVAVHDVLAARLVEITGFPSLFIGSSAVAEFHGLPDWTLTSLDQFIEYGGHIAQSVEIPALLDIDDAGDPVTLYRAVKEMERVGLGAIHLCDGSNVLGQSAGLVPVDKMIDKLHAVADSRTDLVISVRCQGLNLEQREKTLARANAYAEAGAETVWFLPMPLDDLPKTAEAVKIPLTAQFVFDTPMAKAKDYRITVATYASLVQNIASSAVYDALLEFKSTGFWTKSAKGQRLGNTIPADIRTKMLRNNEITEQGKKYRLSQ